eukprot:GEMP01046090.1.p2 GENE.GEMP01046090.1~~GEMP01046090.1.p2  ORF type:complete len:107 (+),score=29.91 GEMP01046090.1:773-1093(+)
MSFQLGNVQYRSSESEEFDLEQVYALADWVSRGKTMRTGSRTEKRVLQASNVAEYRKKLNATWPTHLLSEEVHATLVASYADEYDGSAWQQARSAQALWTRWRQRR